MRRYKVIAITHRNVELDEIGRFHLEESEWAEKLPKLKKELQLDELMYLSTCNRVEFHFSSNSALDESFIKRFIGSFKPGWDEAQLSTALSFIGRYEGMQAMEHLCSVASSVNSMVVGEREIIAQVRNSYEKCRELGLTGDILRLVVQQAIQTGKEVYTRTAIGSRPVSVVSLAYRKLRDMNLDQGAKILFVGASQTNRTMARLLQKHGFSNFTVFNRTLDRAEALAGEIGGIALQLDELAAFDKGFDVMVCSTASSGYIITEQLYSRLLNRDSNSKVVIDLAVPTDFDPAIANKHSVKLIAVEQLRSEAEKNMVEREKELEHCRAIIQKRLITFKDAFKARQVEVAMSDVPRKVKEIKEKAVSEVFAKEIESLDADSKEVLEKIIDYLEKKYISVPMKMAKEIMLKDLKLII